MRNLKHNISSLVRSVIPKLGRVKIEGDGTQPTKPHEHLASITIGGYIAMKSRGFFYKKNIFFSYVLFLDEM